MATNETYTDITPFNASYRMYKELFGHQRGARCACNIGSDHIAFLSSECANGAPLLDTEYLITGGTEGEILVWKLTKFGSCDLLLRFMAHVNTVMCICPSKLTNDFLDISMFENKDSNISVIENKLCIYTCGRDKLIHRFNLAGKKLLTLEGHNDAVCSLHELSDPSRVVSGSWDGTAIVWNILSGTKEYILPCDGYKYSVYVKSLSDKNIITGMQNGDICFWKDTNLVNRKKIHNDAIRSISPSDNILTSSNDCTIKLHTKTLDLIYTIEQHDGFIYDVHESRLFKVFFSASEDKTVRVWSLDDGQNLQILSLESSIWQVIETEFNGIATIESNGKVLLWRLEPGKDELDHPVPVKLPSKNVEPNRIYDMTLFKKFNSEKAHELLREYNYNNPTALTAKEMICLDRVFQKDLIHAKLSPSDSAWVLKLVQWPYNQRLPVFDLIKTLAYHHTTEQIFKGRNNGANIIISACDALLFGESNVQLIAVTLQMLSNLLFPSLSRSLLLSHHRRILESALNVAGNNSRMVQQALASFSQNFVVALTYNGNNMATTHIMKLIETSLKTCDETLLKCDGFVWVNFVVFKHTQSLEMVIKNNLIETSGRTSTNISSILASINNLLVSQDGYDPRCSKLVKFIMDELK